MPSELKPCPFCGGTNIRFDEHRGGGRGMHSGETVWSMCCYDCGATFPNRCRRELLEDAWNTRPEAATPAGGDADLLDEIAEAISDTLDLDWRPSWAAPNILALINRERAAAHAAGRAEERGEVTALIERNLMSPQRYLDAIERGQHKEPKP